jgi:O-antigen chain-terminating methyltransferase
MLVSGFHLAEHLAFSDLQSLVQEAFRVLKTGGLLILETPNPENIVVGSGNFYLDPSHHHPLPPLLLSFLPEFYGFDRVKVLRLQEPLDLKQSRVLTIHDVLGGVSPDYAVIAQKNSLQLGDDFLAQAFSHQYGISLEDVSSAYTDQLNRRFIDLAARTQELKTQGELIAALLARLNTLEKILAPLLWANRQRHALRQQGLKKRLYAAFEKVRFEVLYGINRLLARFPKIRQFIIQSLRVIGLHEWSQRQLNAMLHCPSLVTNGLNQQSTEASIRQAIAAMPVRTQTLYDEISCALEKQKKN